MSLAPSMASSTLARGTSQTQEFESSLLPLIHSFDHPYPTVISVFSLVMELMQYLAFALNPRVPGNRLAWGIIYLFQLPFWDGVFTRNAITYRTFIALYWVISAAICALVVLFLVGLRWTHRVAQLVRASGATHLLSLMLSVLYIPTVQMLMASFTCQQAASRWTYGNATDGFVFLFEGQSCDTLLVEVHRGFSIALLIVWGSLVYIFTVTLIPVDREDASVKRRCNTSVDVWLFIYRTGLCISGMLLSARGRSTEQAVMVSVLSFGLAALHCLYLPYYQAWMNTLLAVFFAMVGWAALTIVITNLGTRTSLDERTALTLQGGMYAILCCGTVVVGPLFYKLAQVRYSRRTADLLRAVLRREFVPVTANPFAVAALQGNLELLPFPRGLPHTDAAFSPLHAVALSILAEGLQEEAAAGYNGRDPVGRAGRGAATPTATMAVSHDSSESEDGGSRESAASRLSGLSASEGGGVTAGGKEGRGRDCGPPFSARSLLREARRRQVVSPTIERALLPSDAEVAVRFLGDWQSLTETLPTPHMVCFASRIFHRFLLKYPKDGMLVVAYVSFLCDYAPSLPRMTLCLELIRRACAELSPSLTERYLLYYFSLHVKESLGIRDAMHESFARTARQLHQQTLLRRTLVWRCLMEEQRSPMAVYTFTNALALARRRCYAAYMDSIAEIADDAALLRGMGGFMASVYHFHQVGRLCDTVSEVVGRLQQLRLGRTQQTSMTVAEEAKELAMSGRLWHRSAAGGGGEAGGGAAGSGEDSGPDGDSGSVESEEEDSSFAEASSNLSWSQSSSQSRLSSLWTVVGRSSQSKVRNSKRMSRLMAERVHATVLRSLGELTTHMQWRVLTYASLVSTLLVVAAIVTVGAIVLSQLQKWERLQLTMEDVSNGHAFTFAVLTQVLQTARLLPEDAVMDLAEEESALLQGNISYTRALISTAEAAHNAIFFGRSRTESGSFLAELTRLSHYFNVHSSFRDYVHVRVSFLSHVPMVLANARRLVDQLETVPTMQDFLNSLDVMEFSSNVMDTLTESYRHTESGLQRAAKDLGRWSIILSAVAAALSLLLVGLAFFFVLWNYRRAASIVTKELMHFYLIPRESVEQLASEAQRELESFTAYMESVSERAGGGGGLGLMDLPTAGVGGAAAGAAAARTGYYVAEATPRILPPKSDTTRVGELVEREGGACGPRQRRAHGKPASVRLLSQLLTRARSDAVLPVVTIGVAAGLRTVSSGRTASGSARGDGDADHDGGHDGGSGHAEVGAPATHSSSPVYIDGVRLRDTGVLGGAGTARREQAVHARLHEMLKGPPQVGRSSRTREGHESASASSFAAMRSRGRGSYGLPSLLPVGSAGPWSATTTATTGVGLSSEGAEGDGSHGSPTPAAPAALRTTPPTAALGDSLLCAPSVAPRGAEGRPARVGEDGADSDHVARARWGGHRPLPRLGSAPAGRSSVAESGFSSSSSSGSSGGDSGDLRLLNVFDYAAVVGDEDQGGLLAAATVLDSSSDSTEEADGRGVGLADRADRGALVRSQRSRKSRRRARRAGRAAGMKRIAEARRRAENIGFMAANYELAKRILEGGDGAGGTNSTRTPSLAASAVAATAEELAQLRRMVPSIIGAFCLAIAGLALVTAMVFAHNGFVENIEGSVETVLCLQRIMNTTTQAHMHASRWVTGGIYGEYVLAANAFMRSRGVVHTCHSALNSSRYFSVQGILDSTILISLALSARNRIDASPDPAKAREAYALVADLTWRQLPQTADAVRLVDTYLTTLELSAWVPYTTSEEDYARPRPERRALAIETLLGPFGLALVEGVGREFSALTAEVIAMHRGHSIERLNRFLELQMATIVCWSVAALGGFSYLYMIMFPPSPASAPAPVRAVAATAGSGTGTGTGAGAGAGGGSPAPVPSASAAAAAADEVGRDSVGGRDITANRYLLAGLVIFEIFALTGIVLAGWSMHEVNKLSAYYGEWLEDVQGLSQAEGSWHRVVTYARSYPYVDYEWTVLKLLNATTSRSIQRVDSVLLPEPSVLNPKVRSVEFVAMGTAKLRFMHYSWLAAVCSIWGRGRRSVFSNISDVRYVRWDMENGKEDSVLRTFKRLYPMDTYLTTFEKDVTANAAEPEKTLRIARRFINSRMMYALTDQAIAAQSVVMQNMMDTFTRIIKDAHVVQWAELAMLAAAFAAILVAVVLLAALSIQAFSRTVEEQIIFQAAFRSRSVSTLCSFGLIFVILVTLCVMFVGFCITSVDLSQVALAVLGVRHSQSTLMATATVMVAAPSYDVLETRRTALLAALHAAPAAQRTAHFGSRAAARLLQSRAEGLYGAQEDSIDTRSLSSSILRPMVCTDPTDPSTGGNQQAYALQISSFNDVLLALATMPTVTLMRREALVPYLADAYSRYGTRMYQSYAATTSALHYMGAERSIYFGVMAALLALSLVWTVATYVLCLRRVERDIREQSLGSKITLLGIPADILNTLPEITEFYDPETGSVGDQIKKRMQQSERLLQNILPLSISRRLKNGERVIADTHPCVTVVFAALVGMDEYSHKLSGTRLVQFMNGLVCAFDHIVDLLDLEKIKLVGDMYFFCGGLTRKTERDHAVRCMEASLFFFQALEEHNSRYGTPNIKLKVGINTGPVVAGVIGNKKVAYDLWGDCVNTASRMYSTGEPGRVQVSQSTYERLSKYYQFEDRQVQAKGKGTLLTRLYVDRTRSTPYTDLNWRMSN